MILRTGSLQSDLNLDAFSYYLYFENTKNLLPSLILFVVVSAWEKIRVKKKGKEKAKKKIVDTTIILTGSVLLKTSVRVRFYWLLLSFRVFSPRYHW